MIPIKYNLRNLRVRWTTTLLTVLATAMVVWSACLTFGFVDGLQYALNVSGDPLDLIVMRNGASTETSSAINADRADEIKNLDGIARQDGQLLAAAEVVTIPVVFRKDETRANVTVRGIEPASRLLRPKFLITQGRDFVPGRGEAIVSTNLARRFRNTGIGELFAVSDKEAYRVVGHFTAGGSSAESEIWVDKNDLQRNTGRYNSVSALQLRAVSLDALNQLAKTIKTDQRLSLQPITEVKYFQSQTESSLLLKAGGILIAVLLSIGAMFAAANTMFSAVKSRSREIGTLRALGFPGRDIMFSFLFESVVLCALGGALGLLATVPLRQLTFGTSNFSTFSEIAVNFRFGPWVLAGAAGMTLAMGLFGGLFPALRAVRLNVINALREQ